MTIFRLHIIADTMWLFVRHLDTRKYKLIWEIVLIQNGLNTLFDFLKEIQILGATDKILNFYIRKK